jgi:hypothetical protein
MANKVSIQRYFRFVTARNTALSLYKGNDAKLMKDFMCLRTSDKYMLAYYAAQRVHDDDLCAQLDTMVLQELIEKKEGKNAPTT